METVFHGDKPYCDIQGFENALIYLYMYIHIYMLFEY